MYYNSPFNMFGSKPLLSLARGMQKDPFSLNMSSMMKAASTSWNPLILKSNKFSVLSSLCYC